MNLRLTKREAEAVLTAFAYAAHFEADFIRCHDDARGFGEQMKKSRRFLKRLEILGGKIRKAVEECRTSS